MKKFGIILLCIILIFAIVICAYLTWERRNYEIWDIPAVFPEYTDESSSFSTLSQEISGIIAQPDMTDEEKKDAIADVLSESGISCTDKDGNNVTQEVFENVEHIYNEGGESAVMDYFKGSEIEIDGLGSLGDLMG